MKPPYLAGGLAVAVVLAGVLSLAGLRSAETRAEGQVRAAALQAGAPVAVVAAQRTSGERTIEVQGEARPYVSVTLSSKVSGYLKELPVERGDRVEAGQLLAVIQSPELDRQYEAARADARVKQANARRALRLAGPGAVSQREADLEQAGAHAASATASALRSQRDYTVLRAPFAGTVTARHLDAGALVQNAATPVVTLSQLDRLRVVVHVDQRDAASVKRGDRAEILLPYQGEVVPGRVSRVAGELEPRTRTMAVEIDLDNGGGTIVPGGFVSVRLHLSGPPRLRIPAAAVLLRQQKTMVAVVGAGDRVKLRPVQVAQHDGAFVALEGGLAEGERVALNLDRSVRDGDPVRPLPQRPGPPGTSTPPEHAAAGK